MENFDHETLCACALGRIFGYEPLYAITLIEKLGSASAVFGLSSAEADGILGPFSKYRGAIRPEALDTAANELVRLAGLGCRYLSCTDPRFPPLLRDCPDCPAGLYIRSESTPEAIFGDSPYIAVVGTRDISPYGRQWTRKIVESCSQAPERPVIVSGLAFGVDINAHITALDCGLATIAVLPCGIDEVYPASHRKIAGRLAASPGSALVTDYPPGTSPAAFTFLRRNRIIAGLARSTILVESKAHGGGLITCRLADSYGREVFALPGRADDPRSAGCNSLIRARSAEMISDLAGLGEQLGLGRYSLRRETDLLELLDRHYGPLINGQELDSLRKVATTVRDNRGVALDDLALRTGLPYGEAASLASTLEADGFICMDLMQRCSVNVKKS